VADSARMARDPLQRDGKAWANALRNIAASCDLGRARPRVGVDLGKFDTRGLKAVPPEIAAVPNLVGVTLTGATFRDVSALVNLPLIEELAINLGCPLPRDALSGLRPLRSLSLSGDGDLDVFTGQAELRQLSVEKSVRTDLQFLPDLPSLEILWLWSLPKLATLGGIERAPALRALSLLDTPVADVGSLRHLHGLDNLSLRGAVISDASPLTGLSNLRTLDLWGAPLADLAPLSGLVNLRSLTLSGGTFQSLEPLCAITGLQHLGLQRCPVTDLRPLSGMVALQSLSLRGTRVTDLSPIAHLTGLGAGGAQYGLDLEDTPAVAADPLLRRNYAAPDASGETARIFARVQTMFA
jgi:Leucine-rich repeat (LRR) protein